MVDFTVDDGGFGYINRNLLFSQITITTRRFAIFA